ncbi:subunit of the Arp2/3 complex [Coelomomyces lativittatus]|nr:subunit of the Arp2/3 complex [Coelomomyces lativittatus]
MPAYHSSFLQSSSGFPCLGNMAVLPIRPTNKHVRVYAPETQDQDIIDEALYVYRANCFFKQYEIQGPADRTLIYLLFVINELLCKLTPKTTKDDALRVWFTQCNTFLCPGEPGFSLSVLFAEPSRDQQDPLRGYLLQLRSELSTRLISLVYPNSNDSTPSKWWLPFSKRKFMNKSLA